MARPTHNIVATLGEYTANDGTTKKRYQTCGVAFTDESGRVSLKLAVLPVAKEWSGWLSLYPIDKEASPSSPPPQRREPPPVHDHVDTGEDDDIPF